MKTDKISKHNLILGISLSFILTCNSSPVFADKDKDMFCGGIPTNNDIFMDESALLNDNPFIDIDYEATLRNVPEKQKKDAIRLNKEINESYSVLEKQASFSEQMDEELLEKEDRLNEIICQPDVKLVTVNLLDKLPKDKRKRAETLWKEIQAGNDLQDKKWDELMSILDSVRPS